MAFVLPVSGFAAIVLQPDSGTSSYSFSWTGSQMAITGPEVWPWQPYYVITVEFDSSFANEGTLRLQTDGVSGSKVWELPVGFSGPVYAYDLNKGKYPWLTGAEYESLDGHLELTMLSGAATVTGIRIEKTIRDPGDSRFGRAYRIDVNPVPEPTVGLLSACAIAGLCARSRRRNRRTELD